MSFSPSIRSTGNFNRQFGREKRRLSLAEIPKSDIDTLQEHVNEGRTYTHFANAEHTVSNISDNPIGPNDYIFEPDYNEVKIRTNFADVHGIGNYSLQTINSLNYYTLELYDQAATSAQMFYAISQEHVGTADNIFNFNKFWNWGLNVHPPQIKRGNSIHLNQLTIGSLEFVFLTNLGTHFDFNGQNFSFGFWIKPTTNQAVSQTKIIAYRYQDASNQWSIELDTDGKLFAIVKQGGVQTKRQFDTPLSSNTWYFVNITWVNTGPTVSLKVNDLADTSSTKTTSTTATTANLYFGSYPGATSSQNFNGYLTGLTYYKHGTVLTSGERTSLYTYNTKSSTTKPGIYGSMQYG